MSSRRRLLIGGAWQEGALGTYDVVNPATGETVDTAPEGSVEQANAAARAAARAFDDWSRTTAEERARLLRRAADGLRAAFDDLLPTVIDETGSTEIVARQMQLPVAIARFEDYAARALHSDVIPLPPQAMPATPLAPGGIMGAMARRAPIGVVACITPYNFPITSMAGKIGPALAMGNTVVVRPAPQDPLAVIDLVRILDACGFPPGVVNVVTGSTPETGEALVASPDVDMVSFTGSSAIGARIAAAAGGSMKRVLLELGGKGAGLVLDDADVANAVQMLASTWTFHSGQICTAPTRAIVHRSLFEPVVEGLARLAGTLKVGDPREAGTVLGPVISAAQRDRIEAWIATAHEDGGEIVCGGERPDEPTRGFYAAPTLVVGGPDMRIAQEEVFGPVITAIPFDDDEEGIAITNGTPYGLYDYVFTGDTSRALETSRRLRSANVGINTTQRNHETPFGGTGASGLGRDGGEFGLHAYSELQSVVWPG
jgi:acyl-CoA reductase-like NAD-dependent aldehyde dehydrogenase